MCCSRHIQLVGDSTCDTLDKARLCTPKPPAFNTYKQHPIPTTTHTVLLCAAALITQRKHLQALVDALLAEPLTAARALELAVRAAGRSVTSQCSQMPHCHFGEEGDKAPRLLPCFVSGALCLACNEGSMLALCQEDPQAGALLVPQLVSLVVSGLKAAHYTIAHDGSSNLELCQRAMETAYNSRTGLVVLTSREAVVYEGGVAAGLVFMAVSRSLLLLGKALSSQTIFDNPYDHLGTILEPCQHTPIWLTIALLEDRIGLLPPVDAAIKEAMTTGDEGCTTSTTAADATGLLRICQDMQLARRAFFDALDGKVSANVAPAAAVARQAGQLLTTLAERALALLPTPLCCNNPACLNLEETAEWLLVKRPGSVCSSCRTVRYCSAACQRAHWAAHKPVCKVLKAALAGGSYELPAGYVGVSRLVQVEKSGRS
jgi:MYND finger